MRRRKVMKVMSRVCNAAKLRYVVSCESNTRWGGGWPIARARRNFPWLQGPGQMGTRFGECRRWSSSEDGHGVSRTFTWSEPGRSWASVLSLDDFRRLHQQQADLAQLPLTIGRALEKADWPQVKEPSGRIAGRSAKSVEGKRSVIEAAQDVYVRHRCQARPILPRPPAIHLGSPRKTLPELRRRAVEQLSALERMDAVLAGFLQPGDGERFRPSPWPPSSSRAPRPRQLGRGRADSRPTEALKRWRHEASGRSSPTP